VAPIDWSLFGRQFPADGVPPLLADLMSGRTRQAVPGGGGAGGESAVSNFESLGRDERKAALQTAVRQSLATVLGLHGRADSIPEDQSFVSLGLDSLTAVELRNRLQSAIGRSIAASAIFE